MGWCQVYETQICEGCGEPMVAGPSSCTCDVCGTTCTGKFTGCPDVWAASVEPVALVEAPYVPLETETGPVLKRAGRVDRAALHDALGFPERPRSRRIRTGHGQHDEPEVNLGAAAVAVAAPPAAPVAPPAAPVGPVAPASGGPSAASLLLEAVSGLRTEVQALTAAVASQQQLLDGLAGGDRAGDRERAAEGARQEFFLTRIEQVAFHLGQSLTQTTSSLADLKSETQRVAAVGELAHESLAVARQIERTSAQVDRHLSDLGVLLEAFGARLDRLMGPAPEPPSAPAEEPAHEPPPTF